MWSVHFNISITSNFCIFTIYVTDARITIVAVTINTNIDIITTDWNYRCRRYFRWLATLEVRHHLRNLGNDITIILLASTFILPLLSHVSGAEVRWWDQQFFPAPGVCHHTVYHSQRYRHDGGEEKEPTEGLYFGGEFITTPGSRDEVDKRKHKNHLR